MRYLVILLLISCSEPFELKTGEPHITNKTWIADSIHYSTAGGLNFIPVGIVGLIIRMDKGDSIMFYNNGLPNYWPFTLINGDYIEPDTFLVHPYDTLIFSYENLTHETVMLVFHPEFDTFYMRYLPE